MQVLLPPEKKHDDKLVAIAWHKGLHRGNDQEVEAEARTILSHMDNPQHFSIRWLFEDYGRPFAFEIRRGDPGFGGKPIARTPMINSVKDRLYGFYMMLFEVLRIKHVNCSNLSGHFKSAGEHNIRRMLMRADAIAARIH